MAETFFSLIIIFLLWVRFFYLCGEKNKDTTYLAKKNNVYTADLTPKVEKKFFHEK
jgi:hypothetical protein